jgi:hypothetical protein
MGKKPLSLASMRTHIAQVKALLRGEVADIDGGLAQILASATADPGQAAEISRFPLSRERRTNGVPGSPVMW